jgi:hypothetical protein
MAETRRSEAESEARRLRAQLAAAKDRSDLMLAFVYPKPERVEEEAELLRVEAELEAVKANKPPSSPNKKPPKR